LANSAPSVQRALEESRARAAEHAGQPPAATPGNNGQALPVQPPAFTLGNDSQASGSRSSEGAHRREASSVDQAQAGLSASSAEPEVLSSVARCQRCVYNAQQSIARPQKKVDDLHREQRAHDQEIADIKAQLRHHLHPCPVAKEVKCAELFKTAEDAARHAKGHTNGKAIGKQEQTPAVSSSKRHTSKVKQEQSAAAMASTSWRATAAPEQPLDSVNRDKSEVSTSVDGCRLHLESIAANQAQEDIRRLQSLAGCKESQISKITKEQLDPARRELTQALQDLKQAQAAENARREQEQAHPPTMGKFVAQVNQMGPSTSRFSNSRVGPASKQVVSQAVRDVQTTPSTSSPTIPTGPAPSGENVGEENKSRVHTPRAQQGEHSTISQQTSHRAAQTVPQAATSGVQSSQHRNKVNSAINQQTSSRRELPRPVARQNSGAGSAAATTSTTPGKQWLGADRAVSPTASTTTTQDYRGIGVRSPPSAEQVPKELARHNATLPSDDSVSPETVSEADTGAEQPSTQNHAPQRHDSESTGTPPEADTVPEQPATQGSNAFIIEPSSAEPEPEPTPPDADTAPQQQLDAEYTRNPSRQHRGLRRLCARCPPEAERTSPVVEAETASQQPLAAQTSLPSTPEPLSAVYSQEARDHSQEAQSTSAADTVNSVEGIRTPRDFGIASPSTPDSGLATDHTPVANIDPAEQQRRDDLRDYQDWHRAWLAHFCLLPGQPKGPNAGPHTYPGLTRCPPRTGEGAIVTPLPHPLPPFQYQQSARATPAGQEEQAAPTLGRTGRSRIFDHGVLRPARVPRIPTASAPDTSHLTPASARSASGTSLTTEQIGRGVSRGLQDWFDAKEPKLDPHSILELIPEGDREAWGQAQRTKSAAGRR
jgi:hypothetical protein